MLVVSFVALGALWKTPQLARHSAGRDLGRGFSRLVLGPVRILAQAISVVLFAVVLAAALVGTTDPFANLAPTWVYVIFWVGLPLLSLLFGNVWRALSPWRAIADAFVWVWERLGREARPLAAYPERFGRYPGAVALFAFVALELCYSNPSNPRALAFAIALYSYVALFGMLAFGRETWSERGEGFAILFAYIARIAPLVSREGRIRLRLPLTGLAGAEPVPGSVAVPRRRARLGRLRRLQPHERPGRTSSPASRRRTSSTGRGPASCSSPGLNLARPRARRSRSCSSRSSPPARLPARR